MSEPILLQIKSGRRSYNITASDKFLDNGACTQLITQKGPWKGWTQSSIVLTKKAIREIGKFHHVSHNYKYGPGCVVFSLTRAIED